MRLVLFLVLALIMSSPANAASLPIERVFAAPELNGPAPHGLQLSPDGRSITFLKPEETDQTTFDLWIKPVSGGPARRLVQGSAVEPKGTHLSEAEKSTRERQRIGRDHGVVSYRWDEGGRTILIPAAGRLYLADPSTGSLKQVDAGQGPVLDARLSPKGGYITFIRDGNIHAYDLLRGEEWALTTQGGGTITFGAAEFVAQEEMGRFTGAWASPDDRLLAFTRVDESPVDVVPRFDIGAEGVTVVQQRYPRAGRPNARVDLYISPLAGGPPVKVDLGSETDVYLARVNWSHSGSTLYVQRENRGQTKLELLAVDPQTGAAKVILTETQNPWITLNDDFTPLKSGDFLWGSSRSGHHHLYLYAADGTLIRPVTQGEGELADAGGAGLHPSAVAGVDEDRGLVYIVGAFDAPLERHLYVTSYKTTQPPQRITSGDGWWGVELARDAKTFIGVYSDPNTPAQTALYDAQGRRLFWIEENRLGPGHPYYPYLDHRSTPEYGVLTAEDGQKLYYSLQKPYGFDPSKRYPAVISVYGGPGVLPTVRKTWGAATDQLLTQAGYVVFRLDNRGTSNRGVAFEAPIHKALGGPEVKDQIVGRNFLAALPYVDPARIGVMGWSYGGFMTLRLLTEPGSGFAAGAAGGPPSDWRLYDTHYTERYMGDPRTDAAAYDASAVLPRLERLAAPGAPRLLLVHGMADDNVVFENSTRIMATLQGQSTPFDLMLYPGERHGVSEPAKEIQLWRTYLAFFHRTLGGSPP